MCIFACIQEPSIIIVFIDSICTPNGKCDAGVVFSSHAKLCGRFQRHIPPAVLFVFFNGASSRTPIPFSKAKDQSTVAQRAETTVGELSLTSCVWSRFPGPEVPTLRLRWVKDVRVSSCNLSPALWAE